MAQNCPGSADVGPARADFATSHFGPRCPTLPLVDAGLATANESVFLCRSLNGPGSNVDGGEMEGENSKKKRPRNRLTAFSIG